MRVLTLAFPLVVAVAVALALGCLLLIVLPCSSRILFRYSPTFTREPQRSLTITTVSREAHTGLPTPLVGYIIGSLLVGR